jgi:hypothetical protein
MGFIFAMHVPVAGLALLPLILGLPLIFSPVHIAFLEMVIDPVCTLVFEVEAEEEDVMRRPPAEPLFSWPLVFWSVLQGFLVFVLVGTIFVIASRRGMPARADFLLAGPSDRKPDSRQQILQHLPCHGDPKAQLDSGVDHRRSRRRSRAQPAGAGSAEPVQLRPSCTGTISA